MAIEVNGKSLETDEEGYLANLNDWEKDVATVMAKEDDIDLSEDHWEIINFLREYYEEYQIAPAVREFLQKLLARNLVKIKETVNTCMNFSLMDQVNKHVNLQVFLNLLVAYK